MIELLVVGVLLLLVIFVGLMMFSVIVAYASQAAYLEPSCKHCLDYDDQDCCEGE